MPPSRLTDRQKKDLVEGFRAGIPTSDLAEQYGCSSNTVSRTVKALLSKNEYSELKAARFRGISHDLDLKSKSSEETNSTVLKERDEEIAFKSDNDDSLMEFSKLEPRSIEDIDLDDEPSSLLALNDADDFNEKLVKENLDEEIPSFDVDVQINNDIFHEVIPLSTGYELNNQIPDEIQCEKLSSGLLPRCVYMLVDKSVELDARPLKEFDELGLIPDCDKDLQALSLFVNQRSAKRRCSRSQRVIKIPDSNVFEISSRFLLARGITRLVLDDTLIALDS